MPEKTDIKIYLLHISEAKKISEEYCREHFPERWEHSLKFRTQEDRLRSIAAGALVHMVLGLEEKDICPGEYGKPYAPGSEICFNLSHAGEYAALAVGERELGVDIEPVGRNNPRVARRVMMPEELAWMEERPDERFPILWTMKEAVSKAVGQGLGLGFEHFSVLPLLENRPIFCCGMEIYGRSLAVSGFRLSVCTVGEMGRVELINLEW